MTDTLARQQQREDTAADWTSVDPVLRSGELGWESDTGKLKIGDGSTPWSSLDYWYGTAADIVALVAGISAATSISSATAVTPDSTTSGVYRYNITGSGSISSMTLTGGTTRPSIILMVKRSGSQTVAWDPTIDFAYGVTPTIPAAGWLTLALFYDDSTGHWVERYRSPDAAVPATTSRAGAVPLGTDADAIAGTSTSVAVVPHALAAALAAYIVSGNPVLDSAVDALLASGTTVTGADLAARLAAKITLPTSGTGNFVVRNPVTGLIEFGSAAGAVTQLLDGTLETTVPGASGSAAIILEAGGFMNGIVGPDPAWSAQTGAPLELIGDVYGSYASTDQASSWTGSDDGITDVKYKKGITVFKSKTSPNTSYRFTSNYNGSNAGSVVSAVWKHTYSPSGKLVTSRLLFDSAGGNPDALIGTAQPNLYRAQGDGSGHPRQTGKMGFSDPLVDGRGYLCHGDGVVQFTESGGVTLKAFNGATTKDTCYALIMDPTKDPATGVDAYVAIASGTDAGVWRINNIQLPGKVGDVGGPTATQLTGGAAPWQPLGIAAVNVAGTTHLIVTDAGLPTHVGGIRHWTGSTWVDITPSGGAAPAPSAGVPGATGGLAGGLSGGGTPNTGVIVYKSIDAVYLSGPGTIRCVIGHDGPDQSGTAKMMWTDDVLTTSAWHFHADTDNLPNYPEKGSGHLLWLGNAPSGPPYSYYMMTKAQGGWDCSDIWIDRTDPTKCYASGRSGLWFFNLVGAAAAQPASNGVGAAINTAVAFHPTNPKIALAGDSDWAGLHWLDVDQEPRMLEHTSGTPALPPSVDGREVRFDVLGGGYLGQAQRSTFNGGDIYYTPDSTVSGSWYSLMHGNNPGLSAWTDYGVRGFSVYKHTDGELVILAFIGPQIAVTPNPAGDPTHAGIWKLKGLWNNTTHQFEHASSASTWTRVSSTFSAFTNQFQVIRGDHGRLTADAGHVFSYDPLSAGAVRSLDNGDTWASFFPRTFRAIYRYGGAVKCDKLVANRVWVTIPGFGSSPGEVWRIDNAHDGTLSSAGATLSGTITAQKMNQGATGSLLDCPGQMVVKTDGSVIVHQGVQGPGSNHHAGLYVSADGGSTWADISNITMRSVSQFVYGMAISADDQTLLLANDGNGVLKFPLAPVSQTVDWLTKTQVLAIQTALQAEIDANTAAIAALSPAAADQFLIVGTDFVVTSQPTPQDVTDGGAPGVGTVKTATLQTGKYEVYGFVEYDSSATNATTAKAKINLVQGTATFTGEISWRGTASSNGAQAASINTGVAAVPGTPQSLGAAGVGTPVTAVPVGVITVTGAGTVKLQWAQNASEATNTTLHGTTFLGFKKIA